MTLRSRRPATTAASLAVSVVVALGLSACGSDDDGDTGADTPSSSATTPSTSASSTPSPTESDVADDSTDSSDDGGAAGAPDDAQTVSALGVSFAVPDDYLVLDAEEVFADGSNSEVLDQLAERLGVTPDQLREQFQSVELLAADRDTEQGEFTDNVNALDTGASALPTEEQAQASFDQLGFTVSGTEQVSTPAGDGIVVSYDGSAGGLDFAGRGLFLDVDGTVVNITVSAGDAETADENADLITSTLAPAA